MQLAAKLPLLRAFFPSYGGPMATDNDVRSSDEPEAEKNPEIIITDIEKVVIERIDPSKTKHAIALISIGTLAAATLVALLAVIFTEANSTTMVAIMAPLGAVSSRLSDIREE